MTAVPQGNSEKVVFVSAFTHKTHLTNIRACYVKFLADFYSMFSDQIYTHLLDQAEKTFDVNLQNSLFQLNSHINKILPETQSKVLKSVNLYFEKGLIDVQKGESIDQDKLEIQTEYQVEKSVVLNTIKGVINSEAYVQLQKLNQVCERMDDALGTSASKLFSEQLLTILLDNYTQLSPEDSVNVILTGFIKKLLLNNIVEFLYVLYRQVEAIKTTDAPKHSQVNSDRHTAKNHTHSSFIAQQGSLSEYKSATVDSSKQEAKAIIAWINNGLFIPAMQMSHIKHELNGQVISTAEIVNLISEKGHEYIHELSGRGQALSQVVLNLMANSDTDEPQLSQVDVRIIKLVEMLFDFLWSDDDIPTKVKVSVSRLQLPTVKFALTSHDFLDNGENPIRLLIDRLSAAGMTIESDDDPVLQEIENVVDRIIRAENFKHEAMQALDEFNKFVLQEEKRAKIIEKRTYSTEFGLASSKHAQVFVDDFLNEQFMQANCLSEHTVLYLKSIWGKVLYITYLQKGVNDPLWAEHATLLEDLVWSLSEHIKPAEKSIWMQKVPEIVKQMKSVLVTRMINPYEMGEVFSELRRKHLDILTKLEYADEDDYFSFTPLKTVQDTDKLNSIASSHDESMVIDESVRVSALAKQEAQARVEMKEIYQWFEQFQPGDWFLLLEDDRTKQRIKLSCMLDQSLDVLFVNRFGMKSKTMHLKDFHQYVNAGTMKKLSKEPFFDRALKNVGRNIMSNADQSKVTDHQSM